MSAGSRRYVGRRGAVWPLGQRVRTAGCGLVLWAGLVVLLGLAFFSVAAILPRYNLLSTETPGSWLVVIALSLAWPAAYLWAGWFRTLLGYWPAPGEGQGIGSACETCGSAVRRTRTVRGHAVCDVCATERARDNRRLIVPPVVLVGLAFVANGIGTLVQLRTSGVGSAWLAPQSRWGDALELIGVAGGVGLTAAGAMILMRIVRRMVLAPMSAHAVETARSQIAAALERERPDRS